MKNNTIPKATVLMSVYNDQKFLKESIDSILEQSFKDFEFLIFDDCSNDNSPNILHEYVKKDSRIKLITNNTNHGLGYNLAKGVEIAKGKYIARMDSDDISLPHRIETLYKEFLSNETYDIIGSAAIEIASNGSEIGVRSVPVSNNDIYKYICLCPFIHPSVMYKRSSILKVGNYNKELYRKQDYDLWLRCRNQRLQFRNIDEPLVKYRYTDNFFEKNNFNSTLKTVKIGWLWCIKSTPLNLFNYYRVIYKLIGTIGTTNLKYKYSNFYRMFDKKYF